ncbi:Variant-specific surface protein, partial [Giardia duodenalis]
AVKEQPGACTSLGAAGCATCSGSGSDEVCLSCTKPEEFIQLNKKSCKANCAGDGVIGDSTVNPKVCKCDDGNGYQLQGDACAKDSEGKCKTANCQECTGKGTANEVCTKCTSTHYLTPTNQCVSDCTAISGYYGDTNERKCKKCNDACAECVGPANNQCSACPAGKKLTYTADSYPNNGGTCGDACKVSADGTGCETCGAQIGGTAYCSKCKTSTQAPLNGNCAASSRAAFCATITSGACTKCNEGYFLKDGGCYQTDRQPGKQVCSNAQGGNGKCQTCANGLAATDGNCAECHPTCATCTEANQPNKCSTCPPGRYLDASKACKLCTETSGSIQGVANCASCAPPSNNQGSVLCYLIQNTNRSGLSAGAIAGISVAVIVVVGGLVGFLCWWFLCRGKA